MKITEWRNIDWDLEDQDNSNKLHGSEFGSLFKLFDWELQFFKHIPRTTENAKEIDDSIRVLRRIEANKKW
jgi:hypothetical protein